ncbi:MAG: CHAD domain-containing protein [Blastocatellia bacterium]|nr:CHAD domain-containing protein [Blastocatellia bacterium]
MEASLRSEVPAEMATFAGQLFRELHEQIMSQEAGAMAGDVEAVHDMRVGIRRLRVALSNFRVCLPREDRQRLKLRLEHLANSLGGVRDLDVMIEAMTLALPLRTEAERPALQAYVKRLQARRRGRLRTLVKYLRGQEYAALKREFGSANRPTPTGKEASHGQAA